MKPPIVKESLSQRVDELTSGETMTEKLGPVIAEDIYATVPYMKTPLDPNRACG